MNFFSYLRALLIIDPLILLATAVYGSINLCVALWDSEGRTQLKVARAWARMLLRIAGVRVMVEGLDKLKPGESYVFAANHVSYMDTPVVLGHIPANFRFMAKEGLFKIPFIGHHLEMAGHIPVPLDDARAAVKVLTAAGKAMKLRGLSVLVFPEGGRSVDGTLQDFRDGAAYLAIKGGVAAVPIGLEGMFAILPMHSHHMRPGRVTMRIGQPIETAEMRIGDRDALSARLSEEIRKLSGQ
jgi:1-acyl-sn-glycerol-3-phosphate acyltransferase